MIALSLFTISYISLARYFLLMYVLGLFCHFFCLLCKLCITIIVLPEKITVIYITKNKKKYSRFGRVGKYHFSFSLFTFFIKKINFTFYPFKFFFPSNYLEEYKIQCCIRQEDDFRIEYFELHIA